MRYRYLPALTLLFCACSGPRRVESARAGTEGGADGEQAHASPGALAEGVGAETGRPGPEDVSTHGSSKAIAPGTPLDAREPDPKRALPRVSVRHIGMHIGGDPNTPESKRPFLQTLERGEAAFLRCYRQVDVPGKGGTFGADLFIASPGGAAEVRSVRQKLGNDEFAACMTAAIGQLRFPAPARATVVSYSLRFDVE